MLVVGSKNAGKRALVRTLLNYAIQYDDRSVIFPEKLEVGNTVVCSERGGEIMVVARKTARYCQLESKYNESTGSPSGIVVRTEALRKCPDYRITYVDLNPTSGTVMMPGTIGASDIMTDLPFDGIMSLWSRPFSSVRFLRTGSRF